MAASFLEFAHPRPAAATEKDERLGHHRAIFCEAKGQRVDPGAPRHVGGRAAEEGDRIGEARAIHMELHAAGAGEIGSASCRERVCQEVSISVVAVSLKTK